MFRFTIRELVLLTVIVALVLGWFVDHTRVSDREQLWRDAAHKLARQAESSLALSETLTQQLKNKNPAASIDIKVNGGSSTTSTRFGGPQAPAANLPLP